MTGRSSSAEISQEALAFLQRRVGLFGLAGGGLGLIFLVFRVVIYVFAGLTRDLVDPSMLYHALAVVLSLLIWLACRTGPRSRRFIHTVETAGLIGTSVAYELMGWYVPLVARPDMIVLLAVTYGLMARCVYVPSSARRTLLLSLAVGAPLIAGTFLAFQHADGPLSLGIRAVPRSLTPPHVGAMVATGTAVWWTLTTILATATSSVIYGLRRDVREARKLGQYTLEEKLGEGGMGVVYRASHAMLRRPTAIKLLPTEKAGEQGIARFEREVQLTAGLTHPNTVTVFDFGRTPEGVFYYAMELLDGAALDAIVQLDGAQPP